MDLGLEVNRWVVVELETQERNSEGVDIISTQKRPSEWLAEQSCHIRGDNSVLIKEIHPRLKKGSVRGCRQGDRKSCGYANEGYFRGHHHRSE